MKHIYKRNLAAEARAVGMSESSYRGRLTRGTAPPIEPIYRRSMAAEARALGIPVRTHQWRESRRMQAESEAMSDEELARRIEEASLQKRASMR